MILDQKTILKTLQQTSNNRKSLPRENESKVNTLAALTIYS